MKKLFKTFKCVISVLIIAVLCSVSVSAAQFPEDISYSFFFVIIKDNSDTENVIGSIVCSDIESVRELTNPEDYEGEYTPMLLVEVKDKNKESFEKAINYFVDKEYVSEIRYDYLLTAPSPWFLPGDSDSDDKITAADARTLLRYSVGLVNNNSLIFKDSIDINGDGEVTAEDARIALRVSVGLEETPELRERKAY